MFSILSGPEIEAAAKKADAIKDELNICMAQVRDGTYRSLYSHPGIHCCVYVPKEYDDYHPDNNTALVSWAKRGAYEHLDRMVHENADATTFHAGSLGSIWFDVSLTGTVSTAEGEREVTKETRVSYAGNQESGPYKGCYIILLDATADENFIQ